MRAIGLAGTAKNTGKTTAMTAMLDEASRQGLRVAITSIGYDGEEFDHLTGLPKPRIRVFEGMLVATASGTLRGATAGFERVGQTGVLTALGEVVLVRVTRPGLVPLAGPPTGTGLVKVIQALRSLGTDLALVDGAFGRMAPFAVLDGLVLATGGARSRDIGALAAEAAALDWIFALPVQSLGAQAIATNLLSASATVTALQRNSPITSLQVEGALSVAALDTMAAWDGWLPGASVAFADSIRLALAGDPLRVQAAVSLLQGRVSVCIVKRVRLLAVTVNPFYPDSSDKGLFRANYLDAGVLQDAMVAKLNVPVVNVLTDGAAKLLGLEDEPYLN